MKDKAAAAAAAVAAVYNHSSAAAADKTKSLVVADLEASQIVGGHLPKKGTPKSSRRPPVVWRCTPLAVMTQDNLVCWSRLYC